jgi:hypothetical protein
MRRTLQSRLNLRDASESRADAIVRGTIVKYDIDVPVGFSSDPRQNASTRRQLQLVWTWRSSTRRAGARSSERKGTCCEG